MATAVRQIVRWKKAINAGIICARHPLARKHHAVMAIG
jgi:hypothetical protein